MQCRPKMSANYKIYESYCVYTFSIWRITSKQFSVFVYFFSNVRKIFNCGGLFSFFLLFRRFLRNDKFVVKVVANCDENQLQCQCQFQYQYQKSIF